MTCMRSISYTRYSTRMEQHNSEIICPSRAVNAFTFGNSKKKQKILVPSVKTVAFYLTVQLFV